jgi:hypothetical protein
MKIGDTILTNTDMFSIITDITNEVWGNEVITRVWFVRPEDGRTVYNLAEFIKVTTRAKGYTI